MACCSRRGGCCTKPLTGMAASPPTTSAGATSASAATTNGSAFLESTDSGMKSHSSIASTRARRSHSPKTTLCSRWTTVHRRRGATTRISRSKSHRNSICGKAARSARFASAPPRRHNLTSWAASRRRSIRASCRGGRASGSATTTRWRCPTGRAPTTWMSVWSGGTPGGCFAPPTTGRGSTTRLTP